MLRYSKTEYNVSDAAPCRGAVDLMAAYCIRLSDVLQLRYLAFVGLRLHS